MTPVLARWSALRVWPPQRWMVAAAVAAAYVLAVGVPTDLVPNPVFGREIPPTWWSGPALAVSAVLTGLLAGTYVAAGSLGPDAEARRGVTGGFLNFFAVGCPVCNKAVLLALGSAAAVTWFEPLQPLLQLAAMGLLAWAVDARLRASSACAVDSAAAASFPS